VSLEPAGAGAATVCVPGRQEPCSCGGESGFQSCNAEGSGYEACRCRVRANNTLMILGIGGVTVGPVAAGAGGLMVGFGRHGVPIAGVGAMIGGGVLLLAGIPMLAVGARKVDMEPHAAWSVRPVVGPGFTGIEGAF
jgi:hypothetical protein